VLGQVVQICLRCAGDAAPVELAGPDGEDRLIHVPRRAARIAGLVREGGKPLALVVLEHLDAEGRSNPEDEGAN
jgi:hypothetical protein